MAVAPSPGGGAIRIATWNLWAMPEDQGRRLDVAGDVLDDLRPDVVCLQEVRVGPDLEAGRRLADRLGLHLAWEPPPPSALWRRRLGDDVAVGNAVLSRWPTSDHHVEPLPDGDGPGEGRSALVVRIATPAGALLVASAQLTAAPTGSALRCRQVRALAAALVAHRRGDETLVVAGDLNAEPDSDEVRLLGGHKTAPAAPGLVLVDVWRYAADGGPGATWDRRNPYAARTGEPSSRIDFVLVGVTPAGRLPEVSAVRTFAHEPVSGVWPSDHAGVVADVSLGG